MLVELPICHHSGSEGPVSVIVVKAVARNCLAVALRARLQIATDLVKRASTHTAVITRGVLQIIFSTAVKHPVEFPAVDDEMRWVSGRPIFHMPTWFFGIP